MELNVITRKMFCKACEQNHRPSRGDYYVMAMNGEFLVLKDLDSHMGSEKGLTPHCITAIAFKQNEVLLQVHCAMDECGIIIVKDDKGEPITYDSLNRETIEYEGKLYTKIDGFWDEVPDDTLLKNKVLIKTSEVRNLTFSERKWKALIKYTFKLL